MLHIDLNVRQSNLVVDFFLVIVLNRRIHEVQDELPQRVVVVRGRRVELVLDVAHSLLVRPSRNEDLLLLLVVDRKRLADPLID